MIAFCVGFIVYQPISKVGGTGWIYESECRCFEPPALSCGGPVEGVRNLCRNLHWFGATPGIMIGTM